MLYVNLFTGVIIYFLNSYFPGKLLGYSSWTQIKDVAPSYGIAFFIAGFIWPLKYLPLTYWIILPIQIIVGLVVFGCLCHRFNTNEYHEIKKMLKIMIAKVKH